MRTWKAVVLLNLALLVGTGWGYAFWGLRAARLERELAAARAAAAGAAAASVAAISAIAASLTAALAFRLAVSA